jgi:peptidoglycan biosynthesis protein MviN/MurJ (putative lipid II flippase)
LVKFGDENTNLFQAMTTYSMRRNFISSLTLQDVSVISDHEQKAGAFWLAYKDRLVSLNLQIFYMNYLN